MRTLGPPLLGQPHTGSGNPYSCLWKLIAPPPSALSLSPALLPQLVDQSGFKDEHLCWGQTQDMALFDKIVTLPKREKKPDEMNE